MAQTSNASVLTLTGLQGRSTGWSNRRKEPRVPCSRELMILPAKFQKGEEFRLVSLFDCSARGLGIVSPEPMEVGEQFLAELSLDGVRLALYTVRHCNRAAGGRHYKIGAEFSGLVGRSGRDAKAILETLLDRDCTPARMGK